MTNAIASVMAALRVFGGWLFATLYWIPLLLIYTLCFRALPHQWVTMAIRFWARTTLSILGVRLEFTNASTLEDRRARIMVCNHESALDIMLFSAICPPCPLAIGKKEVIYIPIINLAWWAFKFVRIDRSNPKKAIASLQRVAEKIQHDSRTLVIAPEGTRTRNGKMLPFKKGAFHIAVQAQAPIYPVVISGAFELMPPHALLPKPGVVKLKFLEPINTKNLTVADVDRVAEETRRKMMIARESIS